MVRILKFSGLTSKAIQNENEPKLEEQQSVMGIAAAKDSFEVASTKSNNISAFFQPASSFKSQQLFQEEKRRVIVPASLVNFVIRPWIIL
jgi:hypothetical protein